MYEIDKGIEIPICSQGPPLKYPWPYLKVGDSFFVEGGDVNNLSNCGIRFTKTHGGKFTTRTQNGGVRVWRIE